MLGVERSRWARSGQHGNGSMSSSSTYRRGRGSRSPFLSASPVHTCGLATDGATYCWGDDADRQLGTGTTIRSSMPVKVAGGP